MFELIAKVGILTNFQKILEVFSRSDKTKSRHMIQVLKVTFVRIVKLQSRGQI